ncbi:hypothetical protein HYZ64_01275 [Candidatus Berkelbacteria bacterium]|nr:hypothetical protein [Candidatus Berkelbacteria bacterium]
MRRKLIIFALCVFVSSAVAVDAPRPECKRQVDDINTCGTYPPPGTCVLINSLLPDGYCCGAKGAQTQQQLLKEWYDCTGHSPPAADCEYDIWYVTSNPAC